MKQDGCSEINKLFWLSKSNRYSIGVDDYFLLFCISLPSIYPAPPQNAISAINASYDRVIICKISFLNYGTNYHLYRLGLYSQIGENRPTVFSSTLQSIISYHDNSCQNIPKNREQIKEPLSGQPNREYINITSWHLLFM